MICCTILGVALFAIFRQNYRLDNVPENNKDFISKLPDDILVSILLRTSTKDSIRSCVLSKRWRDLYKFVPSVNLRCTDLDKRGGDHDAHSSYLVTNRLRNYLLLRSGSKIRSFSFRCCEPRSSDRFESCVHSLARLGVEELVLHFSLPFRFSCHLLFEMQSLKYFHLKWCYLIRNWKSQKYCNSLQTLELTSVTVLYYGALDCIFSNCLSLESLKIEECTFYDKLWISGSLKSLQIKACKGVKEIEMDAPNLLKSLSVYTEGDFFQGKEIYAFRNLRRLDFSLCYRSRIDLLSMIPFLENCPLLQEFHVDANSVGYSGEQVRKDRAVVLHKELQRVEITGFEGTENEMEFASYIVKSAVALEKMHIFRCGKRYIGLNT
ncbi:hypothetical protein ACP275_03G116100 [Erythranthe tilingii]